jgi:integrase
MSVFKRGKVWWYNFLFAGRHVQESSKSNSKTVAIAAERRRRRELEEGFNNLTNDKRYQRVHRVADLASEFLGEYKVRHPKSATFGEYALRSVSRLLGDLIAAEISDDTVTGYQTMRLKENASPKTVNDEVLFLLRILGDRGEVLRARLRKGRNLKLKVTARVGKAYSGEDQAALETAAKRSRSDRFRFALVLAANTGLRSKEFRSLQWRRLDLEKALLTVSESKTEAGAGRTIPLNSTLLAAAQEYAGWYKQRFGSLQPNWYVFPFGKPHPNDPSRPVTTLRTAWRNTKERAGVAGRLHDWRHTVITTLAESGAGDEVIRDIAGHVSPHMLKHYSHIRTEAKRAALESLTRKTSREQK